MAPCSSVLSLFLELVDAHKKTWEHWKVKFDQTIPPWHPQFAELNLADNSWGTWQRQISAAKALVETYYAKSRPWWVEWWLKLEAYHVEGREYATKWLEEQRKFWKLNQVIDRSWQSTTSTSLRLQMRQWMG